MQVKQITFTGADDLNNAKDLVQISEEFPFVEWGILFSSSSGGHKRFPSEAWVRDFQSVSSNIATCAHLCGKWVRDVCKGDWGVLTSNPGLLDTFNRIQLNFHAYTHKLGEDFIAGFQQPAIHLPSCKQFIFQLDGVNDSLLKEAAQGGINAVPLFDLSGGAGVLPDSWPKPQSEYQGYAGGLGPENLKDQLKLIEDAVGDSVIWVDMETRVRNENDVFDLDLCKRCVDIVSEYV